MKLFEQCFPAGCTVSMQTTPQGLVRVRVFDARPAPDWINAAATPKRGPATADPAVREQLLALVRVQPGHSRSHYERLPLKRGGAKGSQARKEALLTGLIDAGLIRLTPLHPPQGRRTHVLYPA